MIDARARTCKVSDKARRKAETRRFAEILTLQQQRIKEKKLPVIVLVEGWGAAGKGSLISEFVTTLDPRFFKVVSVGAPTKEEQRMPFLWRHMQNIPPAGKFCFLDSGWMDETVRDVFSERSDREKYLRRIESIRVFERQLADAGYLLVKFFLHISREEQLKRIEALVSDRNTEWRVSPNDESQLCRHRRYAEVFEDCIGRTDSNLAPWHVLNAESRSGVRHMAFEILTGAVASALDAPPAPAKPFAGNPRPGEIQLLAQADLSQRLSEEHYRERLNAAQKKLRTLSNRLYRRGIPVVIAYEGWDAAGKGGNIRRLAEALDARGYEVHPIAAPEPSELARHYLWRFWTRLPKTGHIAIFDRSWYGRVLVERVEGLCTEAEYTRAYAEINEFEKELTDFGAVVLKFWIHIDPDTQLLRFTDRQNTPGKQWKITGEDWRNREKWASYAQCVDEMLKNTSTRNAPWHIIESNDKKFARVKALEIVIEAISRALRET